MNELKKRFLSAKPSMLERPESNVPNHLLPRGIVGPAMSPPCCRRPSLGVP
jgi:hypothetical protein